MKPRTYLYPFLQIKMEVDTSGTIITNQEFLDCYERLGALKKNVSNSSKEVIWEDLVEILYNLPTELYVLPRPTNDTVSPF